MKQLFTILCEHFSTVLIHPQFSISHHIQDMPAQHSVLTLAVMIEHHALIIINTYDQYHKPFFSYPFLCTP